MANAIYRPMDFVQVTGLVTWKRFTADPDGDQAKDNLSLIIRTSIPGRRMSEGDDPDDYYDAPMFIILGERAKTLDEQIQNGTRIAATGYALMRDDMMYIGSHTFRMRRNLVCVADQVFLNFYGRNVNNVIICGVVSSVYRNAAAGKRFYIPTLQVAKGDGTRLSIPVTHFDQDMRLEPKEGDVLYVIGSIRTKRKSIPDSERMEVLTTIVTHSVSRVAEGQPYTRTGPSRSEGNGENEGNEQ